MERGMDGRFTCTEIIPPKSDGSDGFSLSYPISILVQHTNPGLRQITVIALTPREGIRLYSKSQPNAICWPPSLSARIPVIYASDLFPTLLFFLNFISLHTVLRKVKTKEHGKIPLLQPEKHHSWPFWRPDGEANSLTSR